MKINGGYIVVFGNNYEIYGVWDNVTDAQMWLDSRPDLLKGYSRSVEYVRHPGVLS